MQEIEFMEQNENTDEEREIENYLNVLYESGEVKNFLAKIQEEAENSNIYKYRSRIKNPNSAIRIHRINKKNLAGGACRNTRHAPFWVVLSPNNIVK